MFSLHVDPQKKRLLDIEQDIKFLNINIKMTLPTSSSQNLIECLRFLEILKIQAPNVTSIMILKNPNFLETIKRLTKFIGNQKIDEMPDLEIQAHKENILKIKSLSQEIYEILIKSFNFPYESHFWLQFIARLQKFEKETQNFGITFYDQITFDSEIIVSNENKKKEENEKFCESLLDDPNYN